METSLKKIEKVYSIRIKELINNRNSLDAVNMIQLAVNLFEEITVKGISHGTDSDDDMLLFQYGVYNWGGEHGEYFSFDLTRQFIKPKDDEPYQLSLTLIYQPEQFKELENYNCWSIDFGDIEDFVTHIKNTDGFILANKVVPKTYELKFSQC